MDTKKPFLPIPGFSKYEFNGTICRNASTKSIMGLKKKNGKYQLISDDKKNIDKSPDQLKELVFPKAKPEKTKKVKAPRALDENGEKKKSVMFMVNLRFHEGKSKEDTIAELGITNKQYVDSQWHYANRGYKEKIEKFLGSK